MDQCLTPAARAGYMVGKYLLGPLLTYGLPLGLCAFALFGPEQFKWPIIMLVLGFGLGGKFQQWIDRRASARHGRTMTAQSENPVAPPS